ncbi:MAG: tRNA dihydrouridine synthase DusB [Spirochaetota bacterium]
MDNILYHPIKLPGLIIPGNLFLAPIAGFSDKTFRALCLTFGAALTYTEMVSAEALIRGSSNTFTLLERAENENLLAIQLFVSKPESAAEAVKKIQDYNPALIDLNCGCPVPKVIRSRAGSALLRQPALIRDIVAAMQASIKRYYSKSVPLTVKIRSGWDNDSINFLETAAMAVDGGASMICLHPRTCSQGYTGKARWDQIEKLKKSCTVPVIGSGDLFTEEDAKKMIETTGCDGIMFARGAIGNPFIFENTIRLLETGVKPSQPAASRRVEVGLKHLDSLIRCMGEAKACKEMKKHICAYTKGLPGAARIRNALVRAETRDDYLRILSVYLADHNPVLS